MIKKILKDALKEKLPKDKLNLLPAGYQAIGDILILNVHPELQDYVKIIGETLLQLRPRFRTVCLKEDVIKGEFRTPKVRVIAGDKNTKTMHKEHNCMFELDVSKVMFSKGNHNEKKRLCALVKNGEVIVDMFAGVGYWTIPIAKNTQAKRIYAIEKNPISAKYLRDNVKLNKVDNVVVLEGDCRDILKDLDFGVDRVIMGYLPDCSEFIDSAIGVIRAGGTIHFHTLVDTKKLPNTAFPSFSKIAQDMGLAVLEKAVIVKAYNPGKNHVVLDIKIKKQRIKDPFL